MITLIRKISTIAISLTLIFCSVVPAFAEPTEEQYEYINNKSEAVAAIQAYLNYRGLGVICDVDKAASEWMINQQIELQELFSGIEKTAGGVLKFRYDLAVLQKLNSFVGDLVRKYNFADFNDSNSSQVEIPYSGEIFSDDDGNECLVYIYNSNMNGNTIASAQIAPASSFSNIGSPLKYRQLYCVNNAPFNATFNIKNHSYTIPVVKYTQSIKGNYGTIVSSSAEDYTIYTYQANSLNDAFIISNSSGYVVNGCFSVIKDSSNRYYVGYIGRRINDEPIGTNYRDTFLYRTYILPNENFPVIPIDIKVYTPKGVSPAPDPNEPVTPKDSNGDTYNYNDYQTYIDNSVTNNTTYYPSADEEPETPDTPTVPDFPGGTWNSDGNGGYNFDIDLPDFSAINWSLNGNNISQKFPFSIPWDLMAFFSVLNAEPETPEIQGEIDLGIVTWEIDWNLHQFDGIAAIARNMEFIAFCIGLILATRSLIKG